MDQRRSGRTGARPVDAMVGFSAESIGAALGGSHKPLLDIIVSGKVRGCVGRVGCNNPHIKDNSVYFCLARELITRDVLCAGTGCASIACAKAGLMLSKR